MEEIETDGGSDEEDNEGVKETQSTILSIKKWKRSENL